MKARLLAWSVLLLCLLVVLSGCAVTSVPAAPAAEEMSEDMSDQDMDDMSMWADVDPSGQTVTFWYQHSGSREEALQEIIADFNANNEYGITVEGSNQGGYGDIFSKMLNVWARKTCRTWWWPTRTSPPPTSWATAWWT